MRRPALKCVAPIETPTPCSMMARGLQQPNDPSCRPGSPTRRSGHEICSLELIARFLEKLGRDATALRQAGRPPLLQTVSRKALFRFFRMYRDHEPVVDPRPESADKSDALQTLRVTRSHQKTRQRLECARLQRRCFQACLTPSDPTDSSKALPHLKPFIGWPLWSLALAILVLGLCAGCGPKVPKAQLTLQAVDDSGQPVSGVKISVVGIPTFKQGTTDEQGRFTATIHSASVAVDLGAEKDGFYSINRQTYLFAGITNGQYIPWNPVVQLQLHKVGKPVPMVVKQVDERNIPAINREVGYDLLIGDWVGPYGRGETADFTFQVLKPATTATHGTMLLRLTFSNSTDGLIPVRLFYRDDYGLRLAAMAPERGYSNRWEFQACEGSPSESPSWNVVKNGDQDVNFYFRVRSRTNELGQVISADFGKIYHGIQFGSATYPDRTPLHFLYYLNPDGTRNTEFDTRSNLCLNPGTGGGRP